MGKALVMAIMEVPRQAKHCILYKKRNPARRRIRMGQRMASGPKGAEGSNARMYSADMAIRESIELAQPSEPCSSAIGSATPILTHRCLCSRTLEKCKMSNRRDRSPCPRLTPPSLLLSSLLLPEQPPRWQLERRQQQEQQQPHLHPSRHSRAGP